MNFHGYPVFPKPYPSPELQVAMREPNKNISQFDTMHKSVTRDCQKAGSVHFTSSPDTGCQCTVTLQGRYSANKTIQTLTSWATERATHVCCWSLWYSHLPNRRSNKTDHLYSHHFLFTPPTASVDKQNKIIPWHKTQYGHATPRRQKTERSYTAAYSDCIKMMETL